MGDDTTRQSVLFPHLFTRPLLARFDERHGSSDGGAILLKACDATREARAARDHQGRGRAAGGARTEDEPALRGHQPQGFSSAAVRAGLLCSGDIENQIKELHPGLEIDRTSWPRFLANQFRVLMTAAAYVLMQELRRRAGRTTLARAQVWTVRERLVKLGAVPT